jgi:hypothetical protein
MRAYIDSDSTVVVGAVNNVTALWASIDSEQRRRPPAHRELHEPGVLG